LKEIIYMYIIQNIDYFFKFKRYFNEKKNNLNGITIINVFWFRKKKKEKNRTI